MTIERAGGQPQSFTLAFVRAIRFMSGARTLGNPTMLRNIARAACVSSLLIASPQPRAQEPGPAPVVMGPVPGAAVPPAGAPNRKKLKDSIIEVESKFIEVPEALAKKLGVMPMEVSVPLAGKADMKKVPSMPKAVVANSVVLAPEQARQFLAKLNGTSGVSLLSAPQVAVRSGQRAMVEIIREFRYPTEFEYDKDAKIITPTAFETRNVGITMEVAPTVGPDSEIDLELAPQVVRLEGYIRASDGQPVPLLNGRSVGADMTIKDFAPVKYPKDTVLQPLFTTNKVTTSVSLFSGHTLVLGGMKREVREDGKKPESRVLYVMVTARYIDAKDVPPQILPVATINKDDEEGFVRSPFAPAAKPIDARGLPSGTELKCPTTKQIFRLP